MYLLNVHSLDTRCVLLYYIRTFFIIIIKNTCYTLGHALPSTGKVDSSFVTVLVSSVKFIYSDY